MGKENIKRIMERLSIASKTRSDGTLIWLHVASVGEANIALTLIESLNASDNKLNFLITSGTVSSAEILSKKIPKNVVHQFVPIDNPIFVKIFLNHWRPNLSIFVESELWPCLINEASKKCPLLLANARLSDRSFHRWQKLRYFFRQIAKCFSNIIVQSEIDFKKYSELGAKNILNYGNIKFANKKLVVDDIELTQLKTHLYGKKIIVAASTHSEDEQVLLRIITKIRKQHPESYFIVILRHPNRRTEVAKFCHQLGLSHSIRSSFKLPILSDDLYIVDSFGELGLFFSISDITFVGGSFAQGGHNPIEPAHFGNVILFGPDMSNCRSIASEMVEHKAAIQIHNQQELEDKLLYFLDNYSADEISQLRFNAVKYTGKYQMTLSNYLEIIKKYISNISAL